MLGADPFDLDDALADGIETFCQELPQSLRSDALAAAADARYLGATRRWVERGLASLDDQKRDAADLGWSDLRYSVRPSDSPIPWQNGYDLARRFRGKVIGDSSHDPIALGDPLPRVPYHHMQAISGRLQGLVAADSPACVGTAVIDASCRFLQARSIGAFLSSSASGPSLLTTVATDFQAFTRAFAAEFLAPAAQLRDLVRDGCTSVSTLASEFRVSSFVIRHQLQNHGLDFATDS